MTKEINLKEILHIMRRRIWVILVSTLLMTVAAYLYSHIVVESPLYQSSARILVGAEAQSDNMSTLMVMIKDPTVLEKISQKLKVKKDPMDLDQDITASNIDDSHVVLIQVTAEHPSEAAEIANAAALVLKDEAASLLNFSNVRLLSEATTNPTPINPENNHKMILGLIGGIVVGIGLAFLLNALDDTVQSEKELGQLLETPALGSIAKMGKKNTREPIEFHSRAFAKETGSRKRRSQRTDSFQKEKVNEKSSEFF
ncbi:capsular polysaccharide biosynthesis protein [Pullulanibacillus pueri]|uniref:Capsular polysaccharide biosynthesis protein n=1 Tax=Pullulanibacillus pueri TaxID=1437324 RepID=A0A8J3EM19_9BACL|nr:Wzz/FepE/Etk N-terminal domain-containing protein [Pullulanibacillus pueri]MBM7682420.1 capsular polysaccharide biosynthesis protein [Pullulanibacillus pueri]GGH81709.1 capsular polysaccharide biosynthesis protein [Pullulanibacillus pueri]